DGDFLGVDPDMGNAGGRGYVDAFMQVARRFDAGEIHDDPDVLFLQFIKDPFVALDGYLDFLGGDLEITDVSGGGEQDKREAGEGPGGDVHGERGDRGDVLLNGEGNGQPNQHRQAEREELQPKIVEKESANEVNHLARPVVLLGVAGASSGLAGTAAAGLWRLRAQARNQSNQLRERTGLIRTEERNARSSSSEMWRINCPLYA